jgi:5-methylthioadenosine/S-adenosylhomocysteine deaminase
MTGRILLRGSHLLPVSSELPGELVGDLLIADDKIVYVGPPLAAHEVDARIVDVTGKIVMPGMVDTHRHTWQAPLRFAGADWTIAQYGAAMWRNFGPHYTAADTEVALRLGLAEALDAGITQILDWNHGISSPDHADAAVQAHRSCPARTILAYGQSAQVWNEMSERPDHKSYSLPSSDLVRLRKQYFEADDGLTMLAMAARGPEIGTREVVLAEWQQAHELDLPISVHVGNGTWSAVRPIEMLAELGLLHDRVTYIHCNSITDAELRLIADTGGKVSCSVEEELHMGHGLPAVGRALSTGLRPSLSVDTCSNVAGSLFPIMRAALASVRGVENQRLLDAGIDPLSVSVSALDAVEFATRAGAAANGLGDRTGCLEVGKQADIVIISTDNPGMFPVNYAAGAVVMNGHPLMVESVYVAGRLVKRDGKLLDYDMSKLRTESENLRDKLYRLGGAQLGPWSPDLSNRRLSSSNVAPGAGER